MNRTDQHGKQADLPEGMETLRILGTTFQFAQVLPPSQVRGVIGTFTIKHGQVEDIHCTTSLSFSTLQALRAAIAETIAIMN